MSPQAACFAFPQNASAGSTGAGDASRPLPVSAYETLAFQGEEDVAIWSRMWVCVGFAQDIPDAGDVLPFTVGHHGIHIERLSGGNVAGRFNKAQHGGCRSVPLQCQTGAKTRCSFTSCGYSRDRGPISVSDPDRARHLDQYLGLRPERLLPVAVQAWGPLLVAKLDGGEDAPLAWPSPDQFTGALPAGGQTVWREYNSNWKHLAVALADIENTSFTASAVLFPNAVILSDRERILAVVLQPVSLDRTLCRLRAFTRTGRPMDDDGIADVIRDGTVNAGRAEATQMSAGTGACSGGPANACRTWFEAQVWRALDAVDRCEPAGTFYRTNQKGNHR